MKTKLKNLGISITPHDISFIAVFLPVFTIRKTQYPTPLLGLNVSSAISYQKKNVFS
jgi:hypothetical protein